MSSIRHFGSISSTDGSVLCSLYRFWPLSRRYICRGNVSGPVHDRGGPDHAAAFDGLIRVAKVNAHEVAAYVSSLKVVDHAAGLVANDY